MNIGLRSAQFIGGPDDGKVALAKSEIVIDSRGTGLYWLDQRGERLFYRHEHCDVPKMLRGIMEALEKDAGESEVGK